MNAIHKRRIRKLAAFLAGPVARADARTRAKGRYKFDMSHWCAWNNEEPPYADTAPTKVGLTKELCNTSACAFGWATKVWPRHLKIEDGNVHLRGTDLLGAEAAMQFFGMTEDQADRAFLTGWDRTPKAAAQVLRAIAQEAA